MNYAIIDIAEAVGIRFDLTVSQLRGPGRSRFYARPRQIAMYLSRRHTRASYPVLGLFYGRDHTTIIHGDRVIARMMTEDVAIAEHVAACLNIMEQRGSRVEALKRMARTNPVLVSNVVKMVASDFAGSWV